MLWPGVCVCHKSVLHRNVWTDQAGFGAEASFNLFYTLYFKEIRVSRKVRALSLELCSKLQTWTVRHRQRKGASILWSRHEETRDLPGERDNARNNVRCTQVRKATDGLDGQHQDVDRTPHGSQSGWQRTGINGESTSMVWPTLGSRTAEEQSRMIVQGYDERQAIPLDAQ